MMDTDTDTAESVEPTELRARLYTDGPRLYAVDPGSIPGHPFDELPLTELHAHCYAAHFEVWNYLGGREAAPSVWRREHAADHGLVEV